MCNFRRKTLAVMIAAVCQQAHAEAPADRVLPDVVTTGQHEAQAERKHAAVQKIVISEEEVERYGDATVGDILKRLPGLTFTGPAGVTKDIRMRGLDKGYTQFYINGEPAVAATKERQMQVDRLPADMIERIEIIRNPSAEYDAGSVAGIVNIVLKQRADEVTRLRAAYGKNGDYDVGDAIAQTSRRLDKLEVLLAASYTVGTEDIIEEKRTYSPATGTYSGGEYKPKPARKSELLLTPRLIWHLGEGQLILDPFVSRGTEDKTESLTAFNTVGITKSSVTTENKDDTVARLAGRYDGKATWGAWHAKAGLQETTSDKDKVTFERGYNPATGAYTGAKRATELEELRETSHYAGAGANFSIAGNHRIASGIELRQGEYSSRKPKTEQSFSTAGTAGAVIDKSGVRDKFDIAEDKLIAYLQDEIHFAGSHWLTPGVRYERTARESAGGDGISRDSAIQASSPSLHYRWAARDDLNLRASLSRTMKLPRFDQLNPLRESKSGTAIDPDKGGNPDLAPEKALGLEAGFEKFFWGNRGIAGLNFYNRDVEDFIEERTRLEETSPGTSRSVKRPYNVGQARFWGMELDWRMPLIDKSAHRLSLFGNHSELRGRIDSTGKGRLDVKELPPHVTNLGIDWRHQPSRWSGGFAVNFVPQFTASSINDDDIVEKKTWSKRTGLDLYVGKTFGPLAELRLIAKNILSVRKDERTLKYAANGSVSADEFKVERSEPTIYLTFESRF